jgi:peptidoglycan/xylan/chitin deacetylase (PgdA/CDA1 family)
MLKTVFRFGLSSIPTSVYQRLYPRDVIGLCYHIVSNDRPAHVAHVCPFKTAAQFEADLRYLADNYEVISYDQLVERRAASSEQRANESSVRTSRFSRLASSRSIVITFDDGFRECTTVVAPLLKKYNFPAIFFVTTDFVDNRAMFYRNKASLCIDKITRVSPEQWRKATVELQQDEPISISASAHLTPETWHLKPQVSRWLHSLAHCDGNVLDRVCDVLDIDVPRFLRERRPYLTWDEVRGLQADGHTIGAHGRSHVHLSDLAGEAEIESEIVDSCRIVAKETVRGQVPFAFPFADQGTTAEEIAGIRKHNPQVGLFFNSRGLLAHDESIVHRISSDEPDTQNETRSNLPALIHDAYARQFRRHAIEPLKKKSERVRGRASE